MTPRPTRNIVALVAAKLLVALVLSGCGPESPLDAEPDAGAGDETADADVGDGSADAGSGGGAPDAGVEPDPECENPNTCEGEGVECGSIPDGCGGTISCGGCSDGGLCDGDARQCVEDTSCEPLTCTDHDPGQCGLQTDGCGGTLFCEGCPDGQSCQGGVCVELDCQPLDCADLGDPECGPHPDGCGGTVTCGDCSGDLVCGTGDDRGTCVEPSCEPLTCADYPEVNCGQMPDGCGGLTEECGECTDPEICGGGSLPNVCGAEPVDGCDGLCEDQAICGPSDPDDATAITGTVYAPNADLPIPNAVVYVPNLDDLDDLPPIQTGAVCERCEDEDLGNPLVGTITEFDGSFELRHVPANVEFPLVIKLGQWRRVVTVGPLSRCETHDLVREQTRFPTRQGETSPHDNIPHVAVSTGRVDAIECVFHQLGVEDHEFTRHDEGGRIHLYRSNGGVPDDELSAACSGFTCFNNSCTDHDPNSCGFGDEGDLLRANLANHLYEEQNQLDSYDIVVMDCEGQERGRSNDDLNRIKNYVNSGGRLFASHFAYDWLYNTDELQDTAVWEGSEPFDDFTLATVDTTTDGGTLWDWLVLVGANANDNFQIEITDPRAFVQDIFTDVAERWIFTDAATHDVNYNSVQQFTFNTPVPDVPEDQCGQVAYSAFHVANVNTRRGPEFPTYCSEEMSAQEKVLAYMLFDLAACVSADGEPPPPVCEPQTCGDLGDACGLQSDGCGGVVDCGECPEPCEPLSCAEHGAQCGEISDGCGGVVACGDCPDGQQCHAGGIPNQCGCEPLSCGDHNAECGEISDGCGGVLDCGDCPDPQSCGAGGEANQCGCVPLSCGDHNAECGEISDGCGGVIDCGDCPDGTCVDLQCLPIVQ